MWSYHYSARFEPIDDLAWWEEADDTPQEPVQPREQYKFPKSAMCPHCGRSDKTVNTGIYFHCKCGCVLYNEIPYVDPPEKKQVRKQYKRRVQHIMQCAMCGVDVLTAHYGDKVFCPACRVKAENARKKEWEKNHRSVKK